MPDALALLQQRHSVPSRQLGEPAPDEATLHALLEAAIRVPDHGKLVPFRLIRLQGEAKLRFGERLAAIGSPQPSGHVRAPSWRRSACATPSHRW